MKKILFIAAAMIAALTSCVKEADVEIPQEEEKVWVEFTAGVQTKAELVGTSVTWESEDVISINGIDFSIPVIDEQPAIYDEGASAKFRAEVSPEFLTAASFTAVYPASAEVDGNIVIPYEQDGTAQIIAMAKVNDIAETLNFMHVTSFLKFQVAKEVSTVTVSACEALAGTVKSIVFGTETVGEKTVNTIAYDVVEDTDETAIIVSLGEEKFQPGTTYYAAVLPGVKTGFNVQLDGVLSKMWETDVNIKQGMIANAGTISAPKESVMIDINNSSEITYGDCFALEYSVTGGVAVTFESSDEDILKIDATGNVTTGEGYTTKTGVVTVTVTAPDTEEYNGATASLEITVAKASRNLAYSPITLTTILGEEFTEPELSGVTDGVVYSSSNTAVAEIDATTGMLNVKAAGTTTITASAQENDTYLAGEASYTLDVQQVIYLKPNSNWKASNARFAAYFFGNGETWVDMAPTEKSGVYKVAVPNGYPSVIFCRMNPGTTANDWANKWNQSSDLSIPTDDKNHYVIKKGAWDNGEDDEWKTENDALYSTPGQNTQWAFTGSFNEWSDQNVFQTTEILDLFVVQNITLAANAEVKVKMVGTWDKTYGGGIKNLNPDKWMKVYDNGANIPVNAAGTYDVYFDFADEKLYLMEAGTSYSEAEEQNVDGK